MPTVNKVLPKDIGARRDSGKGVEEGECEPDAYNGVLLTKGLSGTDAVAPMVTNGFAEGKLHKADEEGAEQEQKEDGAGEGAVLDVAQCDAGDYGEVDTPYIKTKVAIAFYAVGKGG